MSGAISLFSATEWFLLVTWFIAVLSPIIFAWRKNASIALGITLAVLFGAMVQTMAAFFAKQGWIDYWFWADLVLVPARTWNPGWWHTMVTSGFLHSLDLKHVLGNVIILGLVGIPLEQRLGRNRYIAIYLISLIGASVFWVLFNPGEWRPAWGASGAAFGLLGAYLAGWPKDEVPFPLILIRPWPISLIALLYLALEIIRWYMVETGSSAGTNIAHMAHLGGFIVAYFALPFVAKGGPYELRVNDGGPKGFSSNKFQIDSSLMPDISTMQDPWSEIGHEMPKSAVHAFNRLRASGDEADTRIAWMEKLCETETCPICQEKLGVVEKKNGPTMQCCKDTKHFKWPASQ